jgi:hypothetical protein
MNTMMDCMRAFQSKPDIAGACVQAVATVQAAKMTASATKFAGWLTFASGIFALGAALAVWLNARHERRAERDKARINRIDRSLVVAVTYIAEIEAVWKFFKDNGLISTLRANADAGLWMDFAPGDLWLMTYCQDPAGVGILGSPLAGLLASCLPRTLNELGRLKWLHSWHPPNQALVGIQQTKCAATLQSLQKQANEVIEKLKEHIAEKTDELVVLQSGQPHNFSERLRNKFSGRILYKRQ